MKKKTCLPVYIALLFLIFLVVLFPYKEDFTFKTIYDYDIDETIYRDPVNAERTRNEALARICQTVSPELPTDQ
jgi:hypothetical protein